MLSAFNSSDMSFLPFIYFQTLFVNQSLMNVRLNLTIQDIVLNFFDCMMIRRLQRSLEWIQHPAHLLIRHFIIIPQGEYNSLFFRKLLDCKLKLPFQLIGIEEFIRYNLVA